MDGTPDLATAFGSLNHWLLVGMTALLAGITVFLSYEALTGFVLLAWSASFTYLEMQRYWRPR